MKNINKKIIAVTLAVLLVLFSLALTSCESSSENLKVGIIQYISHPALDNCREGIITALNKAELNSRKKIELDVQIGGSDTAESDCMNYAERMASDGYDIIITIATPASISAFTAIEGTGIPLVFCAVSDPVSSGLAVSVEEPGNGATGTAYHFDFNRQLELIRAFQPDVNKIGVIYTEHEHNSVSQLGEFSEIAAQMGIEIVPRGIRSASELSEAAADLCKSVDCVSNLSDNNVAANISHLLEAANAAKIPVYGFDIEQVKSGCLAAVSMDYFALGKDAGDAAIRILNGEDVNTIPIKVIAEGAPVINGEVADSFDFVIPESYQNATTVGTNR